MTKKSVLSCLALLTFIMGSISAFADNNITQQAVTMQVNGVALLKVTPGTNPNGTAVSLSLSGASNAGDAIAPSASNNQTRLKITSLATGTTPSRTINVNMTGGTFKDSHTTLTLALKEPNTNFWNFSGAGGTLNTVTLGNSAGGNLVTTTTSAPIASNIKTCWSGVGEDDGYVIEYVFTADNGETPINPASSGLTITYTVTNTL